MTIITSFHAAVNSHSLPETRTVFRYFKCMHFKHNKWMWSYMQKEWNCRQITSFFSGTSARTAKGSKTKETARSQILGTKHAHKQELIGDTLSGARRGVPHERNASSKGNVSSSLQFSDTGSVWRHASVTLITTDIASHKHCMYTLQNEHTSKLK